MPIVVAVLGVILVALSVAFFTISPKEDATQITPSTNVTTGATPAQEITTDDSVAEAALATLTGTAKYTTPARITHDIDVTLTLEGDVVSDVVVDFDKGKGPANDYQKRFASSYRTEVVGKKLSEVSLARVGGASLTSGGFNEAVAAIKSQI
jgi:hypothetical protein